MKEDIAEKIDPEKLNYLTRVAEKIPDLFLKLGVATIGFNATGHWTGALTALVGLRLAQANNLAAGTAGVAVLTGLGIGNLNMQYDPDRAKEYYEQFNVPGLVLPYWMIPP